MVVLLRLFFTGSSTSQRCIKPSASGAFFTLVAAIKLRVRVCVVSPAIGIGGTFDPRPPAPGPPGPCAKALVAPDNITRAIIGNKKVNFLLIKDWFKNGY